MNIYILIIIVLIVVVIISYISFRLVKAESEVKKLMQQSHLSMDINKINKTPFAADVTETKPGDYNLAQFNDECKKMIETLPKRFSRLWLIAKGGMGYIVGGYDRLLKRKVAIKLLSPNYLENDKLVKRFVAEARAVASLESPNVINIHDVGGDKYPFFVMEYLEGIPLDQIILNKIRLNDNEIKLYGLQLANALLYCHNKGIVHGDVKPSNIIISNNNKDLKLVDFGIAKAERGLGDLSTHSSNVRLGSPRYLAPEYIKGDKLSVMTDMYSFGVTLYNMTSGCFPFEHKDIFEVVENDPKPIDEIVPNINKLISFIVMKCISRVPEHRFLNFNEIKSFMLKIDVV